MRYQVILSPYVKDLGKVVDSQENELLCNADLNTAKWIAACLEVVWQNAIDFAKAEELAKSQEIVKT